MQFVSYPVGAMPARWRPDGEVHSALSGGWTPAQRQAWGASRRANLSGPRVGQAPVGARETPTELMLSVGTSLAALTAGVLLAFGAKKGQTTTMWVGILAGTIGGLKLLQTGSKLA
jgi:hypothetical protein